MSAITYLVGDATDPQVPGPKIIAHCVNDIGFWGAGFVLAISKRWSLPERDYLARARICQPNGLPLGEVRFIGATDEIEVANIVGQRGVRVDNGLPPVRYGALCVGFQRVACRARRAGASVHMPRIGCGLAGGEWSEVEQLILRTLIADGVPVYVYDLPKGGVR